MALYQSKTITVNKPFEEVYGKVSDLKNLEQFRDRIPKEYTVNFECDTDYVQFRVAPVGDLLLRIVERGVDKIKLNIEKLPFKAEMSMNIGNGHCRVQNRRHVPGKQRRTPYRWKSRAGW